MPPAPPATPTPPVALQTPQQQKPADPNKSFYRNWQQGAYIPDFDWRNPATWDPGIMKMPLEGAARVARGVEQIANIQGSEKALPPDQASPTANVPGRQMAGGVHNIFAGATEAAAPFLVPPAVIAAPIPTAVGIGVGSLASTGLEKLGEKAGVAPEYRALLGDLGSLIAGGGATGLVDSMLPKLRVGAALTPEEAALNKYSQDAGIPLNAWERSGKEWVKTLMQKYSQSRTAVRSAAEKQALLEQASRNLRASAATPEQAGANLRTTTQQRLPPQPVTGDVTSPEMAGQGVIEALTPGQPVRLSPDQLVPYEKTRPVASYTPDTSGGYSEAEMNARTIRNRNAETAPPQVQQFPVGSWGTDSTGELMQLREYALDDPHLIFPEERSGPNNPTVQKYSDWINQGSEPPPLTGLETDKGNVKIQEGHHRASAIENTGGNTVKVWTTLTRNRPIGQGQFMPEGVNPNAVPSDVLAKYPELRNLLAPPLAPETAAAGVRQGLTAVKPVQPVTGAPIIPEVAGANVPTRLGEVESGYAAGAGKAYDALREMEAQSAQPVQVGWEKSEIAGPNGEPQMRPVYKNVGFPTDMTQAKAILSPFRDRLLEELAPALRDQSQGLHALNAFLDGPDVLPATIADSSLGAIKGIKREPSVNDRTKFLLGQAIDAVSPAIDQAVAAGGQGAADALAEGRALTRAKYAARDIRQSLPEEPVAIFNTLTSPGDVKINLLRDIQTHAPDTLPAVGRAWFQGLLETAETDLPKAMRGWQNMGDAAKSMLLSPDQIANTNNYFTKLKPIQDIVNQLPDEPIKLFDKLTAGGDANAALLRSVQTQAPNSLSALGESYTQGMFAANPLEAIRGWDKLGDVTKGLLFTPERLAQINRQVDGMRPLQAILSKLPGEPVAAFNRLTSAGDANLGLLKQVQAQAPQTIPAIWRAKMQGLLETMDANPRAAITEWRKMGDGTKQILASPDEIARANQFFETAAPIQEVLNRFGREPVKLFNRLTSGGDTNIELLRDAYRQAPNAIPVIADAYTNRLMGLAQRDPQAALKAWGQMGESTRGMLYTPQNAARISNQLGVLERTTRGPQAGVAPPSTPTGSWAKSLAAQMGLFEVAPMAYSLYAGNPKAAIAGAAAHAIYLGARNLGPRIVARMLWNPRMARILMENGPSTAASMLAVAPAIQFGKQQLASFPAQAGLPAMGGDRHQLMGEVAPTFAQGGYLRDLERRAVNRNAVLHHLTRGGT